jgi:hypothetical protein
MTRTWSDQIELALRHVRLLHKQGELIKYGDDCTVMVTKYARFLGWPIFFDVRDEFHKRRSLGRPFDQSDIIASCVQLGASVGFENRSSLTDARRGDILLLSDHHTPLGVSLDGFREALVLSNKHQSLGDRINGLIDHKLVRVRWPDIVLAWDSRPKRPSRAATISERVCSTNAALSEKFAAARDNSEVPS